MQKVSRKQTHHKAKEDFDPEEMRQRLRNLCDCDTCQNGRLKMNYVDDEQKIAICDVAISRWIRHGLPDSDDKGLMESDSFREDLSMNP